MQYTTPWRHNSAVQMHIARLYSWATRTFTSEAENSPLCRISSVGSLVPLWLLINPSSHDGFTWSWLFSVHVVSFASCIWLIAESHFDWITLRNYCISRIGFTATLMLQTGTAYWVTITTRGSTRWTVTCYTCTIIWVFWLISLLLGPTEIYLRSGNRFVGATSLQTIWC